MFTKNQIQEIGKKLGLIGKKDTEFDKAVLPLTGEEWIVLVQNGKNVKTQLKNLPLGSFNPEEPDDPSEPDIPDEPSEPDNPDIPDTPTYDPPTIKVSPSSLTFSKDGETKEVTITTTNAVAPLTVIPSSSDVSYEIVSNVEPYVVKLTMPKNVQTSKKTATVEFSIIGLNGNTVKTSVNIEQEAAAQDTPVKITFSPSSLTFNYNDVNNPIRFTGTFVNCTPVNGMTDNNVSIEYVESLGAGVYAFNAKLLVANNTSNVRTYTGKIKYKDLNGYEGIATISIKVNAAPKGSMQFSDYTLNYESKASSKILTIVTSNMVAGDLSYAIAHDWITVEKISTGNNTHSYKIIVSENTSYSSRSGNIPFTGMGLNGATVDVTLQIIQAGATNVNPDEPGDTTKKAMFIGYLDGALNQQFGLSKDGIKNVYSNVTQEVITAGINRSIIQQMDFESKGKTEYPSTPKETISIFLIPYSSSMNVYKDNGLGGIVPFNHPQLYINGEKIITLGNTDYKIYGEYESGDVFMGNNSGKKYYYIN